MAVKYLAGDRLQGTAAERAALTSNLPVFTDDFSTTSNWTADSTSQCTITGGHVVINPSSGSNSSNFTALRHDMQDDLGSGTNLSDTSWVITFGIDATSYSGSANSDYMDWQFVVTAATTLGSNKSICFGSCYTQSGGGGTTLTPRYIGSVKDGQDNISGLVTTSVNDRRENSSDGTTHTFPLPSTTQGGGSDGKFWIRMQRDTASQFKIYIYNDEAMTSQNSVWTTTDTSLCQELTDLRYLNVYAYQQNSDSWTNEATLDDVKVYNATTSTAAVYPNLPNGAIFEESDTGKHWMFDGTSAWNEM